MLVRAQRLHRRQHRAGAVQVDQPDGLECDRLAGPADLENECIGHSGRHRADEVRASSVRFVTKR